MITKNFELQQSTLWKKGCLSPHTLACYSRGGFWLSSFLPVKKIIEANFILPHKLQGCLVLCLSSGMKVVGGTSEAVNKTFSGSSWWGTSTRGFCDETGEPRRKILTSCTPKRQFRWNELSGHYFWVSCARVGLWYKHSCVLKVSLFGFARSKLRHEEASSRQAGDGSPARGGTRAPFIGTAESLPPNNQRNPVEELSTATPEHQGVFMKRKASQPRKIT